MDNQSCALHERSCTVHHLRTCCSQGYAPWAAVKTDVLYLKLWHLQLRVESQQRCWLQREGQEVGQGVPVPVLAEDGKGDHRGTAEIATVTAQAYCHIAPACSRQALVNRLSILKQQRGGL